MRSYLIGIFLLVFSQKILSQEQRIPEVQTTHLSTFTATLGEEIFSTVSSKTITAVAIHAEKGPFYINENGKKTLIPLDPDAEEKTYFISLSKPSNKVTIENSLGVETQVFLIHSGSVPKLKQRVSGAEQENCINEPDIVSQNEWRSGLPAPNYSRAFTDVAHLIVHHSAGSNTATNYTQVVRDIYVYHTQVNGWSDIGYNFLISQDGQVYAGRDPEGGDQYTVRGAHFCGKNSGTSGICMLGNFESAFPTNAGLISLLKLTAYSAQELGLNPSGAEFHVDQNLENIAGHRDGCATLCPGENLYSQLEDLRIAVAGELNECRDFGNLDFSASSLKLLKNENTILTNRSSGYDEYEFQTPGGEMFNVLNRDDQVGVRYPKIGEYDVKLIGLTDFSSDTLVRENYIQVVEEGIILIPNAEGFQLVSEAEYKEYAAYNLQGKILEGGPIEDEQIRLKPRDRGLIILRLDNKIVKTWRD